MRFRLGAALVACLVAVPTVASMATVSAPSIEGRLIASEWDPSPGYFQFESGSDDYFTLEPGLPSESRPEPWQVRATSDGHVAFESHNDPDQPHDAPELMGASTVTRVAVTGGTRFDFLGLDGAEAPASVTVPTGDSVLAIHERGVLVSRRVTDHDELRLITATGPDAAIAGSPFLSDPQIVDRDADTLLLRNYRRLYTVDLATSTAALVTENALPLDWAALTPGRVVWRTGWTSGPGSYVQHLAWSQRDGSGSGTADVPFSGDLLTIGEDAAVLRVPDGGTYLRPDLVRIPLEGQASHTVASGIASARSLADGRVLVARDFEIDAVAVDETVTKLADLSRPVRGAGSLALSGDHVVNGWYGGMSQTTLASAEWSPIGGVPVGTEVGRYFELGGDTVLTDADLTLRWPGGYRNLDPNGLAYLGHGGKLVAYQANSNWGSYQVQDVRTGQVRATLSSSLPIAMNGTWVWHGPDTTTGVLTGTDVATGHVRKVATPARCFGYLSVVGRWALLSCDANQIYAIDLLGVVPAYQLLGVTWGPDLPELGNGFVAYRRDVAGPQGFAVPEVVIVDLNSANHPERVVGPLRGRFEPPGATFAADEAGGTRLVYADPESRPRVVDVDWLAPAPPMPDTTAPRLTSASAGPRTSPTRTVSFSWSFTDPAVAGALTSGIASYDVQYRQRPRGYSTYGVWQQPQSWRGTVATTVSMTADPGTDTCVHVRARDKVGNLSDWSSDRCSMVDGSAPALARASTGSRVSLANPVRFSFSFNDNTKVVSYDVVYRTAPAGKTLGPWIYPTGWQRVTASAVSINAAAGSDVCFIVRARDAIGNISGWSPMSCAATPQDDRALGAAGSVTRTTSSSAYKGSLSRMNNSGASLSKSGEVGKRIAVVALAGPGQGTVDVYHAGRKIGRVSLASSTWARRVYYLPTTAFLNGSVRVVSVSALPSSIDGVAFLRY